ncbi:hypothetical protein ABT364_08370 [Massilia sp. SR12]
MKLLASALPCFGLCVCPLSARAEIERALPSSVQYTSSVTNILTGRAERFFTITEVQLKSVHGVGSAAIAKVNTKLTDASKQFFRAAANCRHMAADRPWHYESKLDKIVLSPDFISIVFSRSQSCMGSPDFERDAFVFYRKSGKHIPAGRLYTSFFPQEELKLRQSYSMHLIVLNEKMAGTLLEKNGYSQGAITEHCADYLTNTAYSVWASKSGLTLFPEFSQPVPDCQREYTLGKDD